MSNFELSEHRRQISNTIRFGTIDDAEHNERRIKVRSGNSVTGWLPWPADVGRNFIRWQPLRKGTQVILACPSGDLVNAVVIGMLYNNAAPTPSTDKDLDLIQWNDGASVSYNIASKEMTIHSKGELYIKADKDIWLDAQNIHAFERE